MYVINDVCRLTLRRSLRYIAQISYMRYWHDVDLFLTSVRLFCLMFEVQTIMITTSTTTSGMNYCLRNVYILR